MAVLTITKDNFENEVLKSDVPVLVDFWASWCGPCRMMSPIVDQIAEEVTDCKVGKINVDEEPDLAQQFGIMSIPTLLVMISVICCFKHVRSCKSACPKSLGGHVF